MYFTKSVFTKSTYFANGYMLIEAARIPPKVEMDIETAAATPLDFKRVDTIRAKHI
ncbi:hypothetical protein PMJ6TS7_26090 [Paenibacillus melissococcoides]